MQAWLAIVVVVLVVTLAMPAAAAPARALRLGFGEPGWQAAATGPWWVTVDLRNMLNLFHPFCLPETGAAAGASRVVTIPADWQPPFALRFYCSDDYFADAENHKPGKVGTEAFFGHRFKQVLVDGEVVWEHDVTDDNRRPDPTVFTVDLTPHVTAGRPFTLTCRVIDRVSTTQRNDRDVWFRTGTWYAPGDGRTEQPPRFHTAAWFADVMVGEAAAVKAAPAEPRPHEAATAARHQARWPLPPPSEPLPSPAALSLVAPAELPRPGYPLTCGVPLPAGALRDPQAVSLVGETGQPVPVQTSAAGWWPDGSLRWLTVGAVMSHGGQYRLHFGDGRRLVMPDRPVRVSRRAGRLTIDTGAVRIEGGGDPGVLVDAVRLVGEGAPHPSPLPKGEGEGVPLVSCLRPRMSVRLGGKTVPVTARWQEVRMVERGPVAARVEWSGDLQAAGQHLGRFEFRLTAWAGLPTVQTGFRVYNDLKPEPYRGTVEDPPLEVRDLALVADVPGLTDAAAGVDGEVVTMAGQALTPALSRGERGGGTGLRLVQDRADHATMRVEGRTIAGRQAAGWVAAGGQGGWVEAAVWRFRQQFPKSLAARHGQLEIGLFTPTRPEPAYRPRFGEAKRHDVTFTFSAGRPSGEELAALGRLADEPPRLFDANWFCRTGGVNLLDPQFFEQHPELAAWKARWDPVTTERVTGQLGLRNFGDQPYSDKGQWRNGYWAMVQGAINWGLAAGDQRWLERSFEIARHIADIDTIHLRAGHPDWREWDGCTIALGRDHSVHDDLSKWPAFQLGESLVLHYWLTGDPDSLAAAKANADYLIRNRSGVGSVEARSQARPLLTLLRVWQATGDDRYRRAAARYLDLPYQVANVIDWRRGAYLQPTYENWRCVSAGLDSMYGHDIYEYYRLTGDPAAAQLVVALADSIYAESMLPQEEGLGSFLYYVRYSRSSWYYTQMAMLFHMAYDLTADLRFLRAGRAAFARYLLCRDAAGGPSYQPWDNFGWLDPEMGGWEMALRGVQTEPFSITTMTPVPDPARYESGL